MRVAVVGLCLELSASGSCFLNVPDSTRCWHLLELEPEQSGQIQATLFPVNVIAFKNLPFLRLSEFMRLGSNNWELLVLSPFLVLVLIRTRHGLRTVLIGSKMSTCSPILYQRRGYLDLHMIQNGLEHMR